jgi:hypothetical protein
VELLVALVGAGVRVRVAVDSLERPLGIMELHILLLVALRGDLLLALSLLERRAITVRLLLLLLAELLHELLDLLTVLHAVAPRVVYQAPRTIVVIAEGLPRPLVTTWAMAPTSHFSSYSGSGSTSQQLVVATILLLLLFVFVAALSSGICIGLASLPYLWGRF